MITEEQRRALFALREALRLCECANVHVIAWRGLALVGAGPRPHDSDNLDSSDVNAFLEEHPE